MDIPQLFEFSKYIYQISRNNDALFDAMDRLPDATKRSLEEKYKDASGPVRTIRAQASEQLLTGGIHRAEILAAFSEWKAGYPKTLYTISSHILHFISLFNF